MESTAQEDAFQNLLIVIQELYAEKLIDDDQRDQLKGKPPRASHPADMVFDDDAKLSGLYSRYEEEREEMKGQIVQYITSDTFTESAQQVIQEQSQQAQLDLVSRTTFTWPGKQPYGRCHGRQETPQNEGHAGGGRQEAEGRAYCQDGEANQPDGLRHRGVSQTEPRAAEEGLPQPLGPGPPRESQLRI